VDRRVIVTLNSYYSFRFGGSKHPRTAWDNESPVDLEGGGCGTETHARLRRTVLNDTFGCVSDVGKAVSSTATSSPFKGED